MESDGTIKPAVFLFFLSPAMAELLTGSAPPSEFFQPFLFVLLTLLYGTAVVLARELSLRWKSGWVGVLLLGAAFGILQEGLAVKSFFDPEWEDLGVLGTYGRWGGVNVLWAVSLTIYHAVFSIAVPILLVTLLYPDRRAMPWARTRTLVVLGILLWLVVVFCFVLLTPYRPPIVPYLATVALTAVLVLAAWRAPKPIGRPPADAVPRGRPLWHGIVVFIGTFVWFLMGWGLPNSSLPAVVTLIVEVAWVGAVGWFLLRGFRGAILVSERHRFAAAAGSTLFFALFGNTMIALAGGSIAKSGMWFVALTAIVFLIGVGRRVRSRHTATNAAAEPLG